MTSALNLAKYIVNKCVEENYPITNLQLQKILYFIQRDYLREYDECAFEDSIEAWQFGPVVPEVYYEFCYYGAMPIENQYDCANDIDIKDFGLIDRIVKQKRILEPWDLVNETHKPGGAWSKTYNGGLGNRNIISIDLIRKDS